MSYSGNPSLGVETQDRIVTTYNQSVDLAQQGRTQEAELGCGFILKMDPLFQPASELQLLLQSGGDVSSLAPLPLPSAAGDQVADLPMETVLMADPVGEVEAAAPAPPVLQADPLDAEMGEVMGLGTEAAAPMPEAVPMAEAVPEAVPPAPPESVLMAEPAEVVPELPLIDAVPEAPTPEPVAMAEPVAAEPVIDALPLEVAAEPVAAAPGADGDGDGRIGELLLEGEKAFDQENYQAAIDAWSRIFLIDIDHAEATRRIEEARTLMDEADRQVEEVFAEASELRAAGQVDEAKAAFERVLEMDPAHLAAREALDRIESGEPELLPDDGFAAPEVEGELDDLEGGAEGMFDPDAAPEGGGGDFRPPPPAKKGGGGRFRLIAGVVALLLAAGGFFLWTNKDSLFPNSDEAAEQADTGKRPTKEKSDPVAEAMTLWENGEQQMAVDHLDRVERSHSEFSRARKQLAEWKAAMEGETTEAPVEGEPDEARLAQREEILERARSLYAERRYFEAAKAFRSADRIASIDGPAADLYDDSRRQILPIRQQIDFFLQGDWERLIPVLWRMRDDDPENRDVERLLVDSYFNLGVQALRRGALSEAAESFSEAKKLENDAATDRVLELCAGYESRPRDTLFDIYVKQVSYRK